MRVSTMVRYAIGGIGVGVLAVVAFWPEPTEVDTAAVTRAPMQVAIEEDGETRIHDRFVVSAPVAGRLDRIELEPGDALTRGTVVARLSPLESALIDSRSRLELATAADAVRESVGQVRAERDRAIAVLERATAAERRLSNLVEIGAVSREEFESAQTTRRAAATTLQGAEFALSRQQHEWDLARARLSQPPSRGGRIEIRSPLTGVVLKRLKESECVVTAGEPLLEIGDPARLEIVADLLSTEAVRVKPGDVVSIERWGGGHPWHGRVRRIEPSGFLKISALGVEEQRVNVLVDFDDPMAASRQIGDAYRVEVRIEVWRDDDALTVPVGALFRIGNQWAVFLVEGDRVRRALLELGERNNDVAQVIKGLAAGERVVLHPPDTLLDGGRIRLRE